MEEKIKIHLTKDVYNILLKDCESFEFFKKDNITLNKNMFLTSLINNYYKIYQEKENHLINIIDKEILNRDLSIKIVNKINKFNATQNNQKFSEIISLKPTKESSATLSYIERYLLHETSISEYFRNMFTSYASLPQDQREKIIFKTQYEEINNAISKKRKIIFTTKRNASLHEADPYALVNSKEETHYYLLAKYNGTCKTYRLSRIESVTVLNEQVNLNENEVALFNKMIEYGPQFNYENEEDTIIIKLTNRGKEMYKSYYTHRPKVDFIEGDYYYFSCSFNQISLYFRRFGKEAFVVTPKVLQMQFYKFYKNGVNHYIENNK